MTKKARFRQADITRGLKAMKAAGLDVSEVHIALDGTLTFWVRGHEPRRPLIEEDRLPMVSAPVEEQPRVFTVKSLAAHWGCSAGLVRNMIARGELTAFRYGNLVRITREAVAEVEARRE